MAKRRKTKSRSGNTTEIERDADQYMRRRARRGPRAKSAKMAVRTKKPIGLKRTRKKK